MNQPHWKGPRVDGVSQSMISYFLQCPHRFYLRYILGYKEDFDPNANYVWGNGYHKIMELKSQGKSEDECRAAARQEIKDSDYNLDLLMHMASLHTPPPGDTEVEFSIPFEYRGVTYKINGMIDLLTTTGITDYKSKGRKWDSNQLHSELHQDLQVNVYAWASEETKVTYHLVRIPEKDYHYKPVPNMDEPRLAKFMFAQYRDILHGYPIKKFPNQWQETIEIMLEPLEVHHYMQTTVGPLLERMDLYYKHVTQPSFDPDHPSFYNHLFYKTPLRQFDPALTPSFKPDFYDYLIGKRPLDDYIKASQVFDELPSTHE